MSNIQYMRILEPCNCTKCNYRGYNTEFEKIISGELIKGEAPNLDSEDNILGVLTTSSGEYQITYQHIICPECGEEDTLNLN